MIILTLFVQTLCAGFKFKTGLLAIIYHLSLVTCRGGLLLRIVPSVCLFTNVHGINQKLKPKIIFDRSF